jgi:hypothetical protein
LKIQFIAVQGDWLQSIGMITEDHTAGRGIFLVGLSECRADFRTAGGSVFQVPFFREAITLPGPGRLLGLLGRGFARSPRFETILS